MSFHRTFIVADNDVQKVGADVFDTLSDAGFESVSGYPDWYFLRKDDWKVIIPFNYSRTFAAIASYPDIAAIFSDWFFTIPRINNSSLVRHGKYVPTHAPLEDGTVLVREAAHKNPKLHVFCINDAPESMKSALLEDGIIKDPSQIYPLNKSPDRICRQITSLIKGGNPAQVKLYKWDRIVAQTTPSG